MQLIGNSGSGICFRRGITSILALLVLGLLPGLAAATTVTATAVGSDGDDSFSALLTIDDAITPGSLVLSVAVQGDDSRIKIKGFASGLANNLVLSGLSVVGDDVKRSFFNMPEDEEGPRPIDPNCTTCDLVVSFKKPAQGGTDRSVSFTLSHATQSLELGAFANQDIAVLLQVKGAYNSRGEQLGFFFRNRKMMILEGEIGDIGTIPEPSMALLLGLGLAGLSIGERRMRAPRA